MIVRIEFNKRLDEEQIKRTIIRDNLEARILDAFNRNLGGLTIANSKGEDIYTILIEKEE